MLCTLGREPEAEIADLAEDENDPIEVLQRQMETLTTRVQQLEEQLNGDAVVIGCGCFPRRFRAGKSRVTPMGHVKQKL